MANKGTTLARPVWLKHVEEAKFKEEEQKAAAAKAAFDATFNDVENQAIGKEQDASFSSDSESDYAQKLANKPIGLLDPSKCTAAGTGVSGGAAGSAASFVVVTKDLDGRRLLHGGAEIKVKISPDAAAGGVDQEAVIKDHEDGTYSVTYVVAKRGNYMVSVECNGRHIQGSPFPVFFSGGNASSPNGVLPALGNANLTASANGGGSNMSSFPHIVPGFLSGMLGAIPGMLPGATGGAILPGLAASFGEVCRDYLNGQCARTDCKLNHPSLQQLMAALASGSAMGGLSQMPMAPSAAAMAAAQSIVAAQAYQAAQARAAAASKEDGKKASHEDQRLSDILSCTLQVSNLSPLLTAEQLRQLFSYCGEVANCTITDSRQLAYVEYAKASEAKSALDLNNIEVGGRPLNVEMAKSLPAKKPSSSSIPGNSLQPPALPVMMQQVVAMQQLQFQQALLMQQAVATQQIAAVRQASMKTAADMAAVRAAEISKSLKGEGDGDACDEKKGSMKPRSPSKTRACACSHSKSSSPSKYCHDHRSRSHSRSPIRYCHSHNSRPHSRDHIHRRRNRDHSFYYRGGREEYSSHYSLRDRWDREREYDSRSSNRSSRSKLMRRSCSGSPECRREKSQSPGKREGRRSAHH